jgi:hypothetical protein
MTNTQDSAAADRFAIRVNDLSADRGRRDQAILSSRSLLARIEFDLGLPLRAGADGFTLQVAIYLKEDAMVAGREGVKCERTIGLRFRSEAQRVTWLPQQEDDPAMSNRLAGSGVEQLTGKGCGLGRL